VTQKTGKTLQTARSVRALRKLAASWRADGNRIALVPTMGALHDGHLSLIDLARRHADRVIVSIFVNPAQFGPSEDFAAYPRSEASDRARLKKAGVDLVYAPTAAEMYPDGYQTRVAVGALAEMLCGPMRPGHFAGVATVVAKLFVQAWPDIAVFGEKDWQQLAIVRRMARDLDLPVRVLGGPTLREADGLAMSSRNAYLSPREREVAPLLHAVLREAARVTASGEPIQETLKTGERALSKAGFQVEYLEARDGETLAPSSEPKPGSRLFAAARLGKTRLIDNLPITP
jgi:pantoate--beta-alanine ligase